jgi:hypothetical protein
MSCSCGNLQCYVCGESIKDYRHFEGQRKDGKPTCPLHENNDSRLENKIKQAHQDAIQKVLEEGNGLEEKDVKVDLPKAQAEAVPPPMPPPRYLIGRDGNPVLAHGLAAVGPPPMVDSSIDVLTVALRGL